MLKKMKEFSWGYAIIAALLIALGVCFIAFGDAMTVLAISVGAIIADGVENLLCAFMKRTPNEDEKTEEAK